MATYRITMIDDDGKEEVLAEEEYLALAAEAAFRKRLEVMKRERPRLPRHAQRHRPDGYGCPRCGSARLGEHIGPPCTNSKVEELV